MATNRFYSLSRNHTKLDYSNCFSSQFRPDTLDPALLRPGRLDRRVEFALPDNEGRANILKIHARSMSVERQIRYELIARLCPNATGAELRSVCTEAGMFAIRARRKVASEKDFLDAVEKVIRQGSKFSSTALYQNYVSLKQFFSPFFALSHCVHLRVTGD